MKDLEKAYLNLHESAVSVPHAIDESYQVNELSKATLSSYIKKASVDVYRKGSQATHDMNRSNDYNNASHSEKGTAHDAEMADKHKKLSLKTQLKSFKRIDGIKAATDKLTKEQVEEIEALAIKHGLVD